MCAEQNEVGSFHRHEKKKKLLVGVGLDMMPTSNLGCGPVRVYVEIKYGW